MRKLTASNAFIGHSTLPAKSIRDKRAKRVLNQACFGSGLESLEGRTLLSTYVVSDLTDDASDPGSLRAAINAANTNPGVDTITFDPSLSGHTISLQSSLKITDTLVLDGMSASGGPGIQLDGSAAGDSNGLTIQTSGCVITGLAISNFKEDGIHIDALDLNGQQNTGNSITGNYIGTDLSGTMQMGNDHGISIQGATGTTINGNVISGNNADGIQLSDVADSSQAPTLVIGNLIGVDAGGLLALGNAGDGVDVIRSSGIVIGGESGLATRNVISGNFANGIRLQSSSAVVVEGNFIGTDADGSAKAYDAGGNILGNYGDGVEIVDDGGSGQSSSNDTIGGSGSADRNIISGNLGNGVLIATLGSGNLVQGNYVGCDVSGLIADGNGGNGLRVDTAGNKVLGNVIVANIGNGLLLGDGSVVQGNMIGMGGDGVTAMGNKGDGILISGSGNIIGGKARGEGNTIAFNGSNGFGMGVAVMTGTGNSIRGNRIFSNVSIGIDLVAPSDTELQPVTPNDSIDGHSGANLLQNYPVLLTSVTGGGMVTITGKLTGKAGVYTVDFYSNTSTDASGHAQGRTYLGSATVTLAVEGTITFNSGSLAIPVGQGVVTATATDASGNTSEFSASILSTAPTSLATTTTLQSSLNPAIFGSAVTFTATVSDGDPSKIPTGSISFYSDGVLVATVTLDSAGLAKWTTASLAVGSHVIMAQYSPNSGFLASNGSLTETVRTSQSLLNGHIFKDTTGNGLSGDDTGLGSVVVNLLKSGKVVATTTSAADGSYSFSNVATGSYTVQEVTPTGYVRTAPALSGSYTVTASAGSVASNLDFDNYYKCDCQGNVSNITYWDNGKQISDLRGHTHEGDTIIVKFTVAPGHSETVSLVSYTAPGSSFDANVAGSQVVYEFATGTFTSGIHTMTVVIPRCFYQVDFVCGRPIDHFGPANSNVFYSAQGRLFSADNGGTHQQTVVQSAMDMSVYNT